MVTVPSPVRPTPVVSRLSLSTSPVMTSVRLTEFFTRGNVWRPPTCAEGGPRVLRSPVTAAVPTLSTNSSDLIMELSSGEVRVVSSALMSVFLCSDYVLCDGECLLRNQAWDCHGNCQSRDKPCERQCIVLRCPRPPHYYLYFKGRCLQIDSDCKLYEGLGGPDLSKTFLIRLREDQSWLWLCSRREASHLHLGPGAQSLCQHHLLSLQQRIPGQSGENDSFHPKGSQLKSVDVSDWSNLSTPGTL